MSSNDDILRRKCEAILEMTVASANAIAGDGEEGEAGATVGEIRDSLYLDVMAVFVKAMGDVLKNREVKS